LFAFFLFLLLYFGLWVLFFKVPTYLPTYLSLVSRNFCKIQRCPANIWDLAQLWQNCVNISAKNDRWKWNLKVSQIRFKHFWWEPETAAYLRTAALCHSQIDWGTRFIHKSTKQFTNRPSVTFQNVRTCLLVKSEWIDATYNVKAGYNEAYSESLIFPSPSSNQFNVSNCHSCSNTLVGQMNWWLSGADSITIGTARANTNSG
jgi:hypothetical protein